MLPREEARTPREGGGSEAQRAPNHSSKIVLSTVHVGGAEGTRTPGPLRAKQVLSQTELQPHGSHCYLDDVSDDDACDVALSNMVPIKNKPSKASG